MLINTNLGKNKCFSGIVKSSLTQNIIKYIYDKYPIVIYDTSGFEKFEDFIRVQNLIKDKNKSLYEQKNRIHCVLYLMYEETARTFAEGELDFLVSLLNQDMNVFLLLLILKMKKIQKNMLKQLK